MLRALAAIPNFASKAGGSKLFQELLKQSAVPAIGSGALAALSTGDPMAGLGVGGADLLASAGIDRGLHALGKRRGPIKIPFTKGKTFDLAGTYRRTEDAAGKMGALQYVPSGAQQLGIYGGSLASLYGIEPLFYPKPQQGIVGQQLNQRLGLDAFSAMSPKEAPNVPDLADGTLFQLAGNPMRGM